MVWKPKEKPLTVDEAVALAKKELQPFWFGSIPLLAGIRTDAGATAHPLDPAFTSKAWLLLFVDPTTYGGESALVFGKEWNKRYHAHRLGVLAVLRSSYEGPWMGKAAEAVIRRIGLDFPVAIDHEGLLALSFRAEGAKTVLVHQARTLFESTDPDLSRGVEERIQSFLRSAEAGLPLFPPFVPDGALPRDVSRFELGSRHGPKLAPGGAGDVRFAGGKPPSKPGDLVMTGAWNQGRDRITTRDPEASIRVFAPSSRISIVAENLGAAAEPALVAVEVNEVPAFDAFAGSDLHFEESGLSAISVGAYGAYHALAGLPAKERLVRFHFPHAGSSPIAIYGLRFGD